MADELLIELVKRYPVLYDTTLTNYREQNVRNNAWREIAEQMNTGFEDVKNKWERLRNCYTNALKRRRKKSGPAAASLIPWKYERQMEFLLPHLKTNHTLTDVCDLNYDEHNSNLQFSEESAHSPPLPMLFAVSGSTASFDSRTTNNSDNYIGNDTEMTQDMRQKRPATDMDENDHFFLSMSKQLKRLPKTDQAEIKFQLHKLIHASEMKMLQNEDVNRHMTPKQENTVNDML